MQAPGGSSTLHQRGHPIISSSLRPFRAHSLKNLNPTLKTFFYMCVWVIVSECVIAHAHAYSLTLCAPCRTRMNQRYKPVPWQTSYDSSSLYLSATELEDNSAWWNTLQSEHQAAAVARNGPVIIVHIITASHSICHAGNLIGDQWLAYYILEEFSHSAQRESLGPSSGSHTRMRTPPAEPRGTEQTGVTDIFSRNSFSFNWVLSF